MKEKSQEDWMKWVSHDPLILPNVPEHFRTEELYLAALRNPERGRLAMSFVPSDMKTNDFCMKAISCNPLALAFVPIYDRTYTLCQFAILCDPHALEFVPITIQNGSIVAVSASKLGKLHATEISQKGQISDKTRERLFRIMREVRPDMWKLFITSYNDGLNMIQEDKE